MQRYRRRRLTFRAWTSPCGLPACSANLALPGSVAIRLQPLGVLEHIIVLHPLHISSPSPSPSSFSIEDPFFLTAYIFYISYISCTPSFVKDGERCTVYGILYFFPHI